MKLRLYLLFILIISICPDSFASDTIPDELFPLPEDTLSAQLPKETLAVQPISYNEQTFHQLKEDKSFDYTRNRAEDGYSIWEKFIAKIKEFLRKYFFSNITEKQVKTALWIVVSIVVIIMTLLFIFFKPSLFFRNKNKKISFVVEEEDIHELDFDDLIKKALQSEKYTEAIRWKYLRLLKVMHSNGLISWDSHKTVNEYVSEMKRSEIKSEFKNVSRQFLYYRYGNFEASQEDWIDFSSLIQQIIKQI